MNYPYYGFQQQTPVANPDERIWVQNQNQADAYLVAANGFVRLWNATEPIFYEKRSDAMGRPFPMVAYRYEKIENKPISEPNGTSVYERRFDALEKRLEALEQMRKEDNYEHESNDVNADTQPVQTAD